MLIKTRKPFPNIYYGWLHWWLVRIYSLMLVALIMSVSANLTLGFLLLFLLHNCLGFEIIFEDYVSLEMSRQLLILFFRLFTVLCVRQCLLLFL